MEITDNADKSAYLLLFHKKNPAMPSQTLQELTAKVRKEQRFMKVASIIALILFLLLVWRDFISLQETLDTILNSEMMEAPTMEIMRAFILRDISLLLAPLITALLHLLLVLASFITALHSFSDSKTPLLLAMADELYKQSETDNTGQHSEESV